MILLIKNQKVNINIISLLVKLPKNYNSFREEANIKNNVNIDNKANNMNLSNSIEQNPIFDTLRKGYECYSRLYEYFNSNYYFYFIVFQLTIVAVILSYILIFKSILPSLFYLFTILLNFLAFVVLIELILWIIYNVSQFF